MKTFMFQINYHHWHTGRIVEIKLGIVKAANSTEAEKKFGISTVLIMLQ